MSCEICSMPRWIWYSPHRKHTKQKIAGENRSGKTYQPKQASEKPFSTHTHIYTIHTDTGTQRSWGKEMKNARAKKMYEWTIYNIWRENGNQMKKSLCACLETANIVRALCAFLLQNTNAFAFLFICTGNENVRSLFFFLLRPNFVMFSTAASSIAATSTHSVAK